MRAYLAIIFIIQISEQMEFQGKMKRTNPHLVLKKLVGGHFLAKDVRIKSS